MSLRSLAALAFAGSVAFTGAALVTPATASTPADSGTLVPAESGAVTKTWSGTVAPGANADSDCNANSGRQDALNDHHRFSLTVPTGFYATHAVQMQVTSTAGATLDNILTLNRGADSLGSADGPSVTGTEVVTIANPPSGAYDAITCAFAGGGPYTAAVTLTTTPTGGAAAGPVGGTSTTAGPSAYGVFPLTLPGGSRSGEPSIGVDWNTGNVYFQSNLNTFKAVFNGYNTTPPVVTDVSCASTTVESLDPIMSTDPVTGLVAVSQLLANPAFNSITALFSGDPTGRQTACTPSNGGGEAAGPDHQTIGGGAYPKPLPTASPTSPPTPAPCTTARRRSRRRSAPAATTTASVFNNTGAPPYTLQQCGGLHGHVRVGPEGNVYLPNKSCGTTQGLAISKDAGRTWSVSPVTGAAVGATDPSVAADRAGNVFFGYVGGDGKPAISVSKDAGSTWGAPVLVGEAFGIQNATWAEVIAGDAGRAAIGFVGTPTPGDRNAAPFGKNAAGTEYVDGEFHFYVATTIDGGQTYKVNDLTPNDPVQRGQICTNGTTCTGGRNLLDFNDIVVDKTGHVLIGYADGCTAACVTSNLVSNNKQTAVGTIARQIDGPLLFASAVEDPTAVVPEVPVAALLPVLALFGMAAVVLRRRSRAA